MNNTKLYTLGYSNRELTVFLKLLKTTKISVLVDVRIHPVSTRYPHYSQDALRTSVEKEGVVYHWAGRQLGGRRKAVQNSTRCHC